MENQFVDIMIRQGILSTFRVISTTFSKKIKYLCGVGISISIFIFFLLKSKTKVRCFLVS